MRWISTLLLLLLVSFSAESQKLTGIWRGYFSSSSPLFREGLREETFKYEIQIEQQTNNSVKGVTYSYKTTVFYGKAELSGIYTPNAKSLILKETKLVDLKVADKSEPCLMTCYLDYTKIGKLEVLEGTFISINIKDKGDCGSGKVYLERVPTSDFQKEDFLVKKKPEDTAKAKLLSKITAIPPKKTTLAPGNMPKNGSDNLRSKPIVSDTKPARPNEKGITKNTAPAKGSPQKQAAAVPKNQVTTGKAIIAKPPVQKSEPGPITRTPEKTEQPVSSLPKKEEMTEMPKEMKKFPVPRVLVERENNLVKTINTSQENILVEIYDNGTIDNDTISVYHNNELVISNGRLTLSPLVVRIHCDKQENHHEITVVAENLGEIPPNTALMVITAGRERHEIFLASNETRNAKVVINYVPKN